MKYLQDYIEKSQTEAFKKAGAFFAFSKKQFDEKEKEGVKYCNMGAGLICPKETSDVLFEEFENIHVEGIKKDIEENGMEAIIKRELYNHECFYTWDIELCVDALESYGVTTEQVQAVFNKYKDES